MDFNLNVRFDATPALVGAVSTLATAISGCAVMAPQVITPLPGVVSISPLPEPAKVDAPAAEAPTQAAPELVASEQSDTIADTVMLTCVAKKVESSGKEGVKTLFAEFGVKNSREVPQERRAEFLKKLNAL